MKEDITRRFDLAIDANFGKWPEVARYLKSYERKPLCISNLCEQIVRLEKYRVTGINLDLYQTVIADIAKMYGKAVIEFVEQQHYSSAKVAQLKHNADAIKEAEAMLKDLEKESINDPKLTEPERERIKQAIEETRRADEIQT